jgi:hypothetical protein
MGMGGSFPSSVSVYKKALPQFSSNCYFETASFAAFFPKKTIPLSPRA